MQTFFLFAAMPEDVAIPTELFDALAKHAPGLFGMEAGTKRPHLRVRSWLTALKKLSLLLGTMLGGFYQHDIVRGECCGCTVYIYCSRRNACWHTPGLGTPHFALLCRSACESDYAQSRCGDVVLLQRRVVEAIVAARPEPGGWPMQGGGRVIEGTKEWYVRAANVGFWASRKEAPPAHCHDV